MYSIGKILIIYRVYIMYVIVGTQDIVFGEVDR